jgi:hypothetical protein
MIVKIDNKEYKIEKLALGKYAELLEALDKIPEQLNAIGTISEENIIKALPKMLKEALPELLEIVSLGSGIPKETMEKEFGLNDFAKVVKAIFEVNEFDELGKLLGATLKGRKEIAPETNDGLKK